MKNWKTTLGGALSALGTSIAGLSTISAFSLPEYRKYALWCIAGGAVLSALGKFFAMLFAQDAPATPSAQTASQQSGSLTGTIVPLLIISALIGWFLVGCAAIAPGNDKLVVTVERAQTIAAPTFDMVLGADNADRGLWRSKAPAFHNFCEWLRAPQLAYMADNTTTNVPRAIALQLNLDKVKLDYKAGRASSNTVITVLTTMQSAAQQASAWLTIVTNQAVLP